MWLMWGLKLLSQNSLGIKIEGFSLKNFKDDAIA